VHIARSKYLWEGACYERLHLKNYGLVPFQTSLALHFEADFADIFEVRGARRPRRGEFLSTAIDERAVTLGYRGLDGKVRRTRLDFTPQPASVSEADVRFNVLLLPHGETIVDFIISCQLDDTRPRRLSYEEGAQALGEQLKQAQVEACRVSTADGQFNAWVDRTTADLVMMTTVTSSGPYPYAGVPWFITAFGRDGIITALECLACNPGLAGGVLGYLAATQATEVIPEKDAEPGKILHETRKGEMALTGEVPFDRYYGSVDATPLFVMLAAAYYERTADRAL